MTSGWVHCRVVRVNGEKFPDGEEEIPAHFGMLLPVVGDKILVSGYECRVVDRLLTDGDGATVPVLYVSLRPTEG